MEQTEKNSSYSNVDEWLNEIIGFGLSGKPRLECIDPDSIIYVKEAWRLGEIAALKKYETQIEELKKELAKYSEAYSNASWQLQNQRLG